MSTPPDRCPGVFRTHPAADGALARVRVPGGVVAASALDALASAAERYGDGHLEVTGRGNLQVRGIAADDIEAFGAAVTAAGLADDAAHDRVRNIVCSPLTGWIGGRADLRPVAAALTAGLVATAWQAPLSGRFWFGLDDGRGDVLFRGPDVTGVALDAEHGVLVVDGEAIRGPLPLTALPAAMLDAAGAFAAVADGAWRIGDLEAPIRRRLLDSLGDDAAADGRAALAAATPAAVAPEPRVGWFDQPDGLVSLGAVVPFGRLTAEQARYAAAVGVPVIVTAEREILLPGLAEGIAETVVRVLAPLGFVFDARSPWTTLTACTGSPGCARSAADVRADLAVHVAGLDPDADAPAPEHWVGCGRGCGAPAGGHTRVEATPEGYLRTER